MRLNLNLSAELKLAILVVQLDSPFYLLELVTHYGLPKLSRKAI